MHDPSPSPRIRLERVTRSFPGVDGPVHAVREVSLDVAPGETVCLIGTSGCGKTTTLRLVNRLLEPSEGTIWVGEQDAARLDPVRLRRGMGYVIQEGGLFPHMTVAGNVGLLARLEGWDARRVRERVAELLEMVNLPFAEFGRRYPAELSGGQRQRIGVARALMLDPGVLLMDEPFGALDPITRSELQNEFAELERIVAKTTLIVTHDLDEAFLLGNRVALMHEGRLVQVGTLADFRDRPADDYVGRFLERHMHAG